MRWRDAYAGALTVVALGQLFVLLGPAAAWLYLVLTALVVGAIGAAAFARELVHEHRTPAHRDELARQRALRAAERGRR